MTNFFQKPLLGVRLQPADECSRRSAEAVDIRDGPGPAQPGGQPAVELQRPGPVRRRRVLVERRHVAPAERIGAADGTAAEHAVVVARRDETSDVSAHRGDDRLAAFLARPLIGVLVVDIAIIVDIRHVGDIRIRPSVGGNQRVRRDVADAKAGDRRDLAEAAVGAETGTHELVAPVEHVA